MPSSLRLLLLAGILLPISATGRIPDWLEMAMKRNNPALEADQDAVILHDELTWDYSRRGRIRTTVRYAIRVITEEGRDHAQFSVGYDDDADKVGSVKAWVLHHGKKPFEISKKDVTKAKKKIGAVMKLDTGVEVRLKPNVIDAPERVLEHGYDETRQMKFIKVFFNEDLAG